MFLVKNFKIFIFLILFQNIFCIFEKKNEKIIGLGVIGLISLFSYLILKKTKEEKLFNAIEHEFNYYIKQGFFNFKSINNNLKSKYFFKNINYEEFKEEVIISEKVENINQIEDENKIKGKEKQTINKLKDAGKDINYFPLLNKLLNKLVESSKDKKLNNKINTLIENINMFKEVKKLKENKKLFLEDFFTYKNNKTKIEITTDLNNDEKTYFDKFKIDILTPYLHLKKNTEKELIDLNIKKLILEQIELIEFDYKDFIDYLFKNLEVKITGETTIESINFSKNFTKILKNRISKISINSNKKSKFIDYLNENENENEDKYSIFYLQVILPENLLILNLNIICEDFENFIKRIENLNKKQDKEKEFEIKNKDLNVCIENIEKLYKEDQISKKEEIEFNTISQNKKIVDPVIEEFNKEIEKLVMEKDELILNHENKQNPNYKEKEDYGKKLLNLKKKINTIKNNKKAYFEKKK